VIAVCLLTSDRYDYTAFTLRTFAAMNDLSQFALFHADDGSVDGRVPALATSYGFRTLVHSSKRRGWLHTRLHLFRAVAKTKAQWVLFLENDVEWVRAFPWPLFDLIRRYADIYCLRLQGVYKGRNGTDPCMTYHKDDRRKPVKWKAVKQAPEPAQVGQIHWSAQPSVTRIRPLLELHEYGMQSPDRTVRVLNNVTYHIGARRTEELGAYA
jgi:hypothetical protein